MPPPPGNRLQTHPLRLAGEVPSVLPPGEPGGSMTPFCKPQVLETGVAV